jgi:hypothetical protein
MPLKFDAADDNLSAAILMGDGGGGRASRFLNLWANATGAGSAAANSALDSGVSVGQLNLGSERFLYTYINNTALLTAGALIVVGFVVVAVGLFLYDRFVLGNTDYYAKQDNNDNYYWDSSSSSSQFLVAPPPSPFGGGHPYGISRIRRYVDSRAGSYLKYVTSINIIQYND